MRIEALGKLFSKKDEEIVKLLRGKGLLCPPEKCECGGKLILKEANNTQDGLRMKCSICKSAKSAREGSIFKGIKLPLKKILGVLHQFIIDSGIYAASKNTGVSQKGTTKLFQLFRSLIQRYIDDTQVSIGGDGRIVEVDEVSLGHMQKAMPHEDYRKTKKPKPNYTVLHGEWWGATERGSNKLVLEELVGKKRIGPAGNKDVLPLVSKWVKPNTIVMSDGLRSYRTIPKEDPSKKHAYAAPPPPCMSRGGTCIAS